MENSQWERRDRGLSGGAVRALIAILCMGSGACVGLRPEVKDIVENRSRYLQDHFAVDTIPRTFLPYFAKYRRNFSRYKSLSITYAVKRNKEDIDQTCRTSYLGLGLNQVDCELRNRNGFAIGCYFQISYLGLVVMRSQTASYDSRFPRPILEIKEIKAFPADLDHATAGSQYVFEGDEGSESAIGGGAHLRYTLKATQTIRASEISPALQGEATQIDIELTNDNGVPSVKQSAYFLPYYGVAVRARYESASTTEIFEVKSVEIK